MSYIFQVQIGIAWLITNIDSTLAGYITSRQRAVYILSMDQIAFSYQENRVLDRIIDIFTIEH